ncbi:sigma-70 family RNA polymerase sigma factor [bacterium]|nr:sigma-70 family RNA polymerase sigma factor [bacterium]
MAERSDRTGTSQPNGVFRTTHWTEIFVARSQNEPGRHEALREFLLRYWKPVYCYLRCRGNSHEAAKDLTQGFFHEVVLGRGLIQKADRAKARFRTFLLRSLDHYAVSVRRAKQAKRRMPEGGLVSLEEIDPATIPEPVYTADPAEVFDYVWASAVLDQVIAEVVGKCRETNSTTHWEVFRARVLQPILENTAPPSLTDLCDTYGISRTDEASNMILTMKRRFRAVLRGHVRQFVTSDADVDDEIRYLMKVLSRG